MEQSPGNATEIFCPATRRNRYGEEGASRVDKFETMASFVAAKCSGSDNKRSEGPDGYCRWSHFELFALKQSDRG